MKKLIEGTNPFTLYYNFSQSSLVLLFGDFSQLGQNKTVCIVLCSYKIRNNLGNFDLLLELYEECVSIEVLVLCGFYKLITS